MLRLIFLSLSHFQLESFVVSRLCLFQRVVLSMQEASFVESRGAIDSGVVGGSSKLSLNNIVSKRSIPVSASGS